MTSYGGSSTEECGIEEVPEESRVDCCRGGRAGGTAGRAPRGRRVGGEGDRLVGGDGLGVGGGGPGAVLPLLRLPLLERLSLSLFLGLVLVSSTLA